MSYLNVLGNKLNAEQSKEELEETRQDLEKSLPVCRIDAEALTKKIQEVVPEYQFDYADTAMLEKRRELSQKALKNIGDRLVGIFGDDHCRLGHTVFGGREEGSNYADFISHFIPEKMDELKALEPQSKEANALKDEAIRLYDASKKLEAEIKKLKNDGKLPPEEKEKQLSEKQRALDDCNTLRQTKMGELAEKEALLDKPKKELHRAITDYVSRNAATMLDRLQNGTLEDLVDHWRELETFMRVCDMQNTVDKCPDGWYTDEEKTKLHQVMGPIFDQLAEKEALMALLSSGIGPFVDEKQVLTFTPKQLKQLSTLKNSLEIFGPPPGEEDEEYGEDELQHEDYHSPFADAALYINMQYTKLQGLARAHFGMGSFSEALMQDLDGRSLTPDDALEEMLTKHRPIYMMSDDPTATPVLAYMDKSRIGIGDDAMVLYGESPVPKPLPPFDESRKPTGITAWWDGVCKKLGLSFLRPRTCVDYETEKAEYEARRAARETEIKARSNIFSMTKKETLDEAREQFMDDRFKSRAKKLFVAGANLDIREEDRIDVRDKLTTLWDEIHRQQKSLHESASAETVAPEQRTACAASALTCAILEKRLMDNLQAIHKYETRDLYPDVKELLELPAEANTPEKRAAALKNKLAEKTEQLLNSDEMKKLGEELTDDDLKEMCPARSDVRSIMKCRALAERLNRPKAPAENGIEPPAAGMEKEGAGKAAGADSAKPAAVRSNNGF